jgi:hypothetical protein
MRKVRPIVELLVFKTILPFVQLKFHPRAGSEPFYFRYFFLVGPAVRAGFRPILQHPAPGRSRTRKRLKTAPGWPEAVEAGDREMLAQPAKSRNKAWRANGYGERRGLCALPGRHGRTAGSSPRWQKYALSPILFLNARPLL